MKKFKPKNSKKKENIISRTLSTYFKGNSTYHKIFRFMCTESKYTYNHFIFCADVFDKFKGIVYKRLMDMNLNKSPTLCKTSSKSRNVKIENRAKHKNLADELEFVIDQQLDLHYHFYSKYKKSFDEFNNAVYKYVTETYIGQIYNFNIDAITKEVVIHFFKYIYDNLRNNLGLLTFYNNIIQNIVHSVYRHNYFKTKYEIDNNIQTTIRIEPFIEHVKSNSYLVPSERVKKIHLENKYNVKFTTEQNILGRFALRQHRNGKLPRDMIINIFDKAYDGFKSYYEKKMKGLRSNKPKYLSKDDMFILPFYDKSRKEITENKKTNIRLSLGKYVAEHFPKLLKIPITYVLIKMQVQGTNNTYIIVNSVEKRKIINISKRL